MNLESQVVSLDLAKRLKQLGVKQKSLFYYDYASHMNNGIKFDEPILDYWHDLSMCPTRDIKDFVSAFTSAELGEMLPYEIYNQELFISKGWNVWEIKYQEGDYPHEKSLSRLVDDTLADVMAKMLIHLLENNLIKIEDLNNKNWSI